MKYMWRTLYAVLALLTLPTLAYPGAWMRNEGTGFLSSSVLQGQDGQSDAALYFEYGLRPKLTLGVKIDASMTLGQISGGAGYVFARRPISVSDRPFNLAYEIGLGARMGDTTDPLLKTALSYGRGLKWGERYGWLALDASVEWSLGGQTHVAKFDTTVGFSLNDTSKIMMQAFVSKADSATSLTLAPSFVWQPRPEKPSYQFGLEAEQGTISLRLGLWQEF